MSDQNNQPPQNASGAVPANAPVPVPQKPCKKCGTSMPKFADVCPACGAKQKPFYKRAWFWVLIVLVLVLLGMGSCVGACSTAASEASISTSDKATSEAAPSSDGAAKNEAAAPEKSKEKYTLANEALVDKGYGLYGVSGTFTNLTDKEIGYVQITYSLLDADGAQVGTSLANTSNLAAGGIWKYETVGTTSGDAVAVSFKMSKVTGF
ncbi:MAG: FxLYD domain-containing protein [Raoultibacter sp.]